MNFAVWTRASNGWVLELRTSQYTYGYDKNKVYTFVSQAPKVLLDKDYPEFDPDRQPGHSGYDDTMIYWNLEGKTVKDFVGWTDRVYVVSSDDKFIDGFVDGTIRPEHLERNMKA